MNITAARAIPLYVLVQHLGGKYAHTDRDKQVWYFSPFRPNEKTASFKINETLNKWYDFGHAAHTTTGNGSGGDIIDLWCDYHGKDRRSAIKEALAALAPFAGTDVQLEQQQAYKRPLTRLAGGEKSTGTGRYKIIRHHERIFYPSLTAELQKRRISEPLATRYLKQVWLQDTVYPEKKQNGFAFRNDCSQGSNSGYEISVPNPKRGATFKTSIRPKAPTTFRALVSSKVFVFEGMWDFLSWMQMQDTPGPEHNIVVLNSLSFCREIVANIIAAKEQIETVILFLDNDDAGTKATHFMNEALGEAGLTVRSMQSLYAGYKDLSDYWAKDPAARKVTEQQQAAASYDTSDGTPPANPTPKGLQPHIA